MDAPGHGALDLALVGDFVIALFIGALIGVERERKLEEHPHEFGGLRTFTLIALAGALAALLSQRLGSPWLYVAGLLGLVVLVSTAYVAAERITGKVSGLTGEMAAIVTWLLAGTVIAGQRELAVMLAIVVTGLLAFKRDLHKVVHGLAQDDIVAGLQLLFASFIVLPLLPDRPLDPWGALNPYKLWLLVVLISALSLIGYAAVRLFGERLGMTLTGFFGGLVSSTAVTLTFARRSHEQGAVPEALGFGLLLAWAVMLVRILVLTGALFAPLAGALLVPILAMLAASLGYLVFLWRRSGVMPPPEATRVEFRNPFSLLSAIQFGAAFAIVLVVVAVCREYLPDAWLYPVAVVAGTTDVDAIALTMSTQAGQGLAVGVAAFAIVLAALSNTVVKAGMVVTLGTRDLARVVLVGAGLTIGAGLLGSLALL